MYLASLDPTRDQHLSNKVGGECGGCGFHHSLGRNALVGMLPVELKMAAPEEERSIRGLRWSDVGMHQVQMQLSMRREAGKMDVRS